MFQGQANRGPMPPKPKKQGAPPLGKPEPKVEPKTGPEPKAELKAEAEVRPEPAPQGEPIGGLEEIANRYGLPVDDLRSALADVLESRFGDLLL